MNSTLLFLCLFALAFKSVVTFRFNGRNYGTSRMIFRSSESDTQGDGIDAINSADNPPIASYGQVFVCTNRWCREKGSDATMASFTFLTPTAIPVQSVTCLGRCNKGPNVRILTPDGAFVEASAVRSVERVVELLQQHLSLDINATSADVLRLNYEGNVYLRNGDVDKAVECYDRALELGDKEQEGVLLVMRGTALLQRAYACRMRHKDIVKIAEEVLPNMEFMEKIVYTLQPISSDLRAQLTLDALHQVSKVYHNLEFAPNWNNVKARWIEIQGGDSNTSGEELLSKATFTWALYESSLMQALQDLLTATLVLPGFAQAWRRAGDALSEVRRFHSAIEYYEVAIRLDNGLAEVLLPKIEKLKVLERLVENAEHKGWSADAILALVDE